jgi:hypothetical protein
VLGRIKKGEYVVGLRAIGVGEWRFSFRRGPAIVKGIYIGKMRDCYMVETRRGKVWLCSEIKKRH